MKNNKEKLISYGMYCNFIRDIKHYESIQTNFRLLASTILLGSLAAIGFIFSTKIGRLPYERIISVIIIKAISIITMIIFWNIDLKFYEKQLISHFAEVYRLESEYDYLPKVHHNMLHGVHKKDRPSNIVYYYIGCIFSIIITTALVVSLDFFQLHNKPVFGLIFIANSLILMSIIFFILKRKTKKIITLLHEIYFEEKK